MANQHGSTNAVRRRQDWTERIGSKATACAVATARSMPRH